MIAALTLAALLHATAPPSPQSVVKDAGLTDLAIDYAPQGVTIKVEPCGIPNAFYDLNGHVTVCSELVDLAIAKVGDEAAGAIRFAALHEIGHAVIQIEDVPFTGNEELAADEYATVMLLEAGETKTVDAGVDFFIALGQGETDDPTDPHPTMFRRAFTMFQYARGATDPSMYPGAFEAFYRAANAWTRLLGR